MPSFPTFYTNVEHQTSNHAILELSRQILANVAVMSSVILVCMREQKVRTNAMIRESEMFIMFCPKLLSRNVAMSSDCRVLFMLIASCVTVQAY